MTFRERTHEGNCCPTCQYDWEEGYPPEDEDGNFVCCCREAGDDE